jgi:hypothetical protein
MAAWSYSSIKTFDQCPKKYYHLRVAKDVKDEGGTAALYGTAVHEAAERRVKFNEPLPAKFAFMEPIVGAFAALPGEKHAELKLGVRKTKNGYEPCDFFDRDVWWRGVIDLVILNGDRALMVDYKTGKNTRYADMKQLDLMAGALFVHYPHLTKVKSALAFVLAKEFLRKEHLPGDENVHGYLNVFETELDRLEHAEASGVWNAKSGPLCGFCPVTSCAHYRDRGY